VRVQKEYISIENHRDRLYSVVFCCIEIILAHTIIKKEDASLENKYYSKVIISLLFYLYCMADGSAVFQLFGIPLLGVLVIICLCIYRRKSCNTIKNVPAPGYGTGGDK